MVENETIEENPNPKKKNRIPFPFSMYGSSIPVVGVLHRNVSNFKCYLFFGMHHSNRCTVHQTFLLAFWIFRLHCKTGTKISGKRGGKECVLAVETHPFSPAVQCRGYCFLKYPVMKKSSFYSNSVFSVS